MKLNMLDSDFDFFVFWELPCMQNCFIYLRHYYFLLGTHLNNRRLPPRAVWMREPLVREN